MYVKKKNLNFSVHKKNRKNFEDANGILVDVEKYLEETNEMRRVVNSINPR